MEELSYSPFFILETKIHFTKSTRLYYNWVDKGLLIRKHKRKTKPWGKRARNNKSINHQPPSIIIYLPYKCSIIDFKFEIHM